MQRKDSTLETRGTIRGFVGVFALLYGANVGVVWLVVVGVVLIGWALWDLEVNHVG